MKCSSVIIFFVFSLGSLLGQENKYNTEWIKLDEENFNRLSEYISESNHSIDYFFENLDNLKIIRKQKVWTDVIKYQVMQYGGEISSAINIMTYKNDIFHLEIKLGNDKDVIEHLRSLNENINKELLSNWKLLEVEDTKREISEQYIYIFEDKLLMESFKNSIRNFLGTLNNVKYNNDITIRKAYELLMSPILTYDYGISGLLYEKNLPARDAINLLIEDKRVDLIQNITRGYNISGRAYGLEALIRIKEYDNLGNDDIETLKKLSKIPFPVTTCIGDLISYKRYEDILVKLRKNGKGYED